MSDPVNDAALVLAEAYKRELDDLRLRLIGITTDVQAWISAGNFSVVGYPPHDHVSTLDDGVMLANPPIRHQRCERCGLVQERYEYEWPVENGRVSAWRFDEFENIARLVTRLQAVAQTEKTG